MNCVVASNCKPNWIPETTLTYSMPIRGLFWETSARFREVFSDQFPGVRISLSGSTRGSGDPFVIVKEDVLRNHLFDWKNVFSSLARLNKHNQAESGSGRMPAGNPGASQYGAVG